MVNCSSCGKEIPNDWQNIEGTGYVLRREWKRRGYRFCNNCVTSGQAREWAEKEDEKIRNMN
jgi:hypothetical protein